MDKSDNHSVIKMLPNTTHTNLIGVTVQGKCYNITFQDILRGGWDNIPKYSWDVWWYPWEGLGGVQTRSDIPQDVTPTHILFKFCQALFQIIFTIVVKTRITIILIYHLARISAIADRVATGYPPLLSRIPPIQKWNVFFENIKCLFKQPLRIILTNCNKIVLEMVPFYAPLVVKILSSKVFKHTFKASFKFLRLNY